MTAFEEEHAVEARKPSRRFGWVELGLWISACSAFLIQGSLLYRALMHSGSGIAGCGGGEGCLEVLDSRWSQVWGSACHVAGMLGMRLGSALPPKGLEIGAGVFAVLACWRCPLVHGHPSIPSGKVVSLVLCRTCCGGNGLDLGNHTAEKEWNSMAGPSRTFRDGRAGDLGACSRPMVGPLAGFPPDRRGSRARSSGKDSRTRPRSQDCLRRG